MMRFLDELVYLLLKGVGWIFYLAPTWFKRALAQALAWLWWDVLRLRRLTVFKNIHGAFPHMSRYEKNHLARQSLFFMAYSFLETLSLSALTRENLSQFGAIYYPERLNALIQDGRGALVMSLHLGNGDVGVSMLSLSQIKLHLISKLFKSEWLTRAWFRLRKEKGTQFIPPHSKDSAFQIMKALKSQESVIFVIDQFMGRPYALPNYFFGRVTATAYGLALFAMRNAAPVVPAYSVRNSDMKLSVFFGEPIQFEKGLDKDVQLQVMTQRYTDCVEALVRRFPDQWMWVHRRWKRYE